MSKKVRGRKITASDDLPFYNDAPEMVADDGPGLYGFNARYAPGGEIETVDTVWADSYEDAVRQFKSWHYDVSKGSVDKIDDILDELMEDSLNDTFTDFEYDPGYDAHKQAFIDHLERRVRNNDYRDDWKKRAADFFDENVEDYKDSVVWGPDHPTWS